MQFVGHADITDDLNLVNMTLYQDPTTKIVNLDPDTQFDNSNVIVGSMLLPPPDAMIAMANQDEAQFDLIYNMYFDTPEIQQYITIILAYLYKKGNLLFYSPILKDPTENIIIVKFLNLLYDKYGLGIGVINQTPCNFNMSMKIIWNNLLYSSMIISPREFLINHPVGMQIDIPIMEMLKQDLSEYLLEDDNLEKERRIYELSARLKEKPNLIIPVGRMYQ